MLAVTLLTLCVAAGAVASAQAQGEAAPQSAAPAKAPAPAAQDPAERIIAVARDVSPEWAESLEKVRERDPAGFERATGVLAKRLKALAVLKDRKPQLYALRVEELRIQGEVTALADQWRSAISTGRAEEATGIEAQLRSKVGTMVDLNLRSRAMELAELDEVMRSMRGDLERDARARDATVMEALEAYRRGEEPAIGRAPVAVPQSGAAPEAADAAASAPPAKGPREGASAQKAPAPASARTPAPAPKTPAAPAPAQGTP
jgi:hypothetical protein